MADKQKTDVVDIAEKLDRILDGFDLPQHDKYLVGLVVAAHHIAAADIPDAALSASFDLLAKFTHEFRKNIRRRMN